MRRPHHVGKKQGWLEGPFHAVSLSLAACDLQVSPPFHLNKSSALDALPFSPRYAGCGSVL